MNSYLPGFRLVATWAARHGHQIVLAVTTPPGTGRRYGAGDNPFVLDVPADIDVLVTGRLRTVAAPVIAALEPDLVISAAYPRLIPPEILDLPRYGALNLHPSALPAGRGPNPIRLVYDGAATVGATVHRTAREFDTGAILSRRERPLPEDLTGPALFASWTEMLAETLEEGAARAIAGEPGEPQDESTASYAAAFTAAELVLDLNEPAATIRRRTAALNALGDQARVRIGDRDLVVHAAHVEPVDARTTPGTVLDEHPDGLTVQAGDDAVRLVLSRPSA
ncbi:MAG TPA: formyltransferase family protein [Kribbellaceae bacterium]|nr:formyltransferase family protein [Kribbellaceae bacterium]